MQMFQHIFPVLSGIRMEIIHKIRQPRPYLSKLVLSLRTLNIHISPFSLIIGIPLSISDARFNNGNVFVLVSYGFHAV